MKIKIKIDKIDLNHLKDTEELIDFSPKIVEVDSDLSEDEITDMLLSDIDFEFEIDSPRDNADEIVEIDNIDWHYI